MSVKQAILDFTDGEIRNKIFVTPDIPAKKLSAARSQFISRDEEVIVLYDDTVFGSAKDGIAITENYIYAKQLWEVPKSIKISSIRSIASQSKSLNNLEIYLNGNLFITVSPPEKADHAFLIGILRAAKDAAAKPEKNKGRAAPAAEAPSPLPARSAPEAKSRSDASEEMRSCEECSAVLPTGAKFCLECGTKVMPKGICLECNAKLPEKARFCPECGTPAGKALAKAAEPKVDTAALRAELASWLSSAEQDASIDNDGDLTVSLNATAPAFAKDFRGWVAQYDLKISSEGVTEEISDSSFYGRDEEFFIRSPYRRVGKLASASYELATKLQVYTLQELEIHEIVLKDGALSIPKLGSTQVKIKTLSARRDDDGSYGVEYELEAYPNHVVHFEVLREKPDEEGGVWARVQEEDTQSGTSWLWDVEPGQKVYVCFGEYKPLVDGVEATFSGRAEPAGGAYGDADEADPTINLSVGSVYRLEPREKNNFKEIIELSYGSGKASYRNRTYRSGAIKLTIADGDELTSLQGALGDDYFSSSEFSDVELDHCFDLIYEEWEFENDRDRLEFEPNDSSENLLEHLEANHGFEARGVHYEFVEGGFSTTPIDGDSQDSVLGSSDGNDGAGNQAIFQKQSFHEFFEGYEDKINERGIFAQIASKNESSLYYFYFDVDFFEDGTWNLIGILDVETEFTLDLSEESTIIDYMEKLVDDLYSELEEIGLDPQKMGDYKVRVFAQGAGQRSKSDAPTSAPHVNEGASVDSALQQLAERAEISLTASGRLARYFRDCDNLFTSIGIEHGPGNLLKVSIVVETDGQADDLEEAEEAIGDYIFDAFLTAGLIEIFGEEGYEDLEFDNHFKVKSLEDRNDSRGDHPTAYSLDQLRSDPSVQETLQAVEGKLLERGTLLSLLSGDDPEVSINFEFINPYNMDQNCLFIVINVSDEDTDPDDIDDDEAEALGDFVYSKISEMSDGFSKKSKEAFEGIEGTILRVNGIFKG